MLQKMFIVKFLVFNCIIKIKKNKKLNTALSLEKVILVLHFLICTSSKPKFVKSKVKTTIGYVTMEKIWP